MRQTELNRYTWDCFEFYFLACMREKSLSSNMTLICYDFVDNYGNEVKLKSCYLWNSWNSQSDVEKHFRFVFSRLLWRVTFSVLVRNSFIMPLICVRLHTKQRIGWHLGKLCDTNISLAFFSSRCGVIIIRCERRLFRVQWQKRILEKTNVCHCKPIKG